MNRLGLKNEQALSRVFIFSNSINTPQERAFQEVCNELNIESVFVKGKLSAKAASLKRDNNIVAAVIFQRKNPGEDLHLISEIKVNLRKLPIIFYSTRYSEDVETLIRRTGVHYFLTPGFAKEELTLVLAALVEKIKSTSY